MGIILLVGAAACAKAPAVAATLTATVTPLPTATLAPTETEDPFGGLNICRTWQEAENCPITVADFERLPDFVKANFEGFPKESMRVTYIGFVSEGSRTSYISIHALTKEEKTDGTGVATETSTNTKKEYIYGSSLSPIGKPYFFMLEKNPPVVENDLTVVAVFPVNNADGSVGTYTIIVPPWVFGEGDKTPEDNTKLNLIRKFEKLPYLPPVYEIGNITTSIYRPKDKQGSFINEVYEDTNDPNGERRKLFEEWKKTGVIPKELEKLPLFGSDMNLNGGFQ